MMNNTPYFMVATTAFDCQIKSNIEKQDPAQCHRIGWNDWTFAKLRRGDPKNCLLTVLQYNSAEHKFNEKVDLSASAIVYGDDIISILQCSDCSIMICGHEYKTALILSIPSMQKTKSLTINSEVPYSFTNS